MAKFVWGLVLSWAGFAAEPLRAQALADSHGETARPLSRLRAADLGVVINTSDPYSVDVGAYYVQRRQLKPEQVLRVELPRRAVLSVAEFEQLRDQIQRAFGDRVQALALVWTEPFAVECNALTAALAIGFQGRLCEQSCAASRASPMFATQTSRPYGDLGVLPAMQLAARSVEAGRALVDRGLAADASLVGKRAASAQAYFVSTEDKARNVRAALFPAADDAGAVAVRRLQQSALPEHLPQTLIYQTGLMRADLASIGWWPGALADHLTSFGGRLDAAPDASQMSALDWLEAGATASYGTVSEPCNHWQKFPHPRLLLQNYLQGSSALEAYWRSVAWPGQGVFIGEPLAAPLAPLSP